MVTEPSVVVCSILLANRLLVKSYPTSFVSVRFRPVVPETPSTVKVIVAKVPLPEEALFETLCFHAQQAAEKSIKAVLLHSGIPFPKTHNLKILLELLPPDQAAPEEVRQSVGLTDYAGITRYPRDFEPVTEEEYEQAARMAEIVLRWAEGIVKGGET